MDRMGSEDGGDDDEDDDYDDDECMRQGEGLYFEAQVTCLVEVSQWVVLKGVWAERLIKQVKDVTFKGFVIGELYIFIILRGRANLKNNFVYFLHDWDIETWNATENIFYYR